jgi:hypothetical protein
MLEGTFRQLNAEFGFSLQVPAVPHLRSLATKVSAHRARTPAVPGHGQRLQLLQPEFAERLGRALSIRLRSVYESVANDLELWSKSTAQLDAQLRERKRSFARRIEADRIQQAATGLEERITEIEEGRGRTAAAGRPSAATDRAAHGPGRRSGRGRAPRHLCPSMSGALPPVAPLVVRWQAEHGRSSLPWQRTA